MRKVMPVNIIVCYPKTEKGRREIARKIAAFQASKAAAYLKKLNCPSWQKIELIDTVVKDLKYRAKSDTLRKEHKQENNIGWVELPKPVRPVTGERSAERSLLNYSYMEEGMICMKNEQQILKEIAELVGIFEEQKKMIYEHYDNAVALVISGKITSENEMERIMDGLLDFGDDEDFFALYKKLCRHVYKTYPQMVGEHIALFRMQFEEKGDKQ